MKAIKTLFFSLILLGTQLAVFGQDFSSKIKDNATVVFSLNGENILDKVPEDKINISQLFYQIKKEFRITHLHKLSDLGFNFNSTLVYAMEVDTNMVMNLFFMPIEDQQKFEALAAKTASRKTISEKDGYKWVSNYSKTEHIVWNSEFAVFAFGYYTGSQYGYKYYKSDYNYYQENRAIEKVVREDTANKLTLKQKSDRVDEILGNSYKLADFYSGGGIPDETSPLKKKQPIKDKVKPKLEVIEDTEEVITEKNIPPPPPPPPVVADIEEAEEVVEIEEEVAVAVPPRRSSYRSSYNSEFNRRKREISRYRSDIRNKIKRRKQEIRRKKKAELISSLFNNRFNLIFNKDIANSISRVSSFKKGQDKKADGILWMKNDYIQNGLKSSMSYLFRYGYWGRRSYRRNRMLRNSLYQFGEDVSITKFFFEKKGIRFTKTSDNDRETANSTNEIFSTKQDSRFFKYVNGDDFIGYASSSINSEAAIKELPKLWMDAYNRYYPRNSEEMNVLAEVIEVFMDEKAIGELATGNAFFLFKDMKNKEVKYTTYEYDENYRRKRVEKTRKELRPEFLFMLTTKNETLLTRIIKLGIKNRVITQKGNYYSTQNKRSKFPLDLFFAIKDGIVFITTNETEITTIVNGGTYKGLSRKHQKLSTRNSQVVYFDNEKLMKFIPEEAVKRRNRDELNYFKQNGFEEVLITTKNVKGNLFSEGFMSTPNSDNSAMYLFEFMNQMIAR